MNDLPGEIEVRGTVLNRIGLAEGFACWSADLPGDEPRTVSIVVEPAGPAADAAVDSAAEAIAGFDGLTAAAASYLVAELTDPRWALDAEDLARLDGREAPFDMPEAIIWADGTWMIRFAECALAMGEEFGIGVRFVGSTPVGIEDLSGATEIVTD